MQGITMEVSYLNDETEECTAHLPARWEICYHCRGTGKSSAYLGAFTQSEWAEQDNDFREDYMAGRYDRACDDCDGLGRVLVLDREAIEQDPAQRAILAKVDEERRELAEVRAIERAERMMGA